MCKAYVIDDDPIHQKITDILIKRTGAFEQHTIFPGAFAALEMLKEHKDLPGELPDVILLDLNMPVLDGWDFLNRFQECKNELKKNITVYIVSSSTIQSEIARSAAYPFVKEFITKPLNPIKLLEISNTYKE